jgi:hypothetical protein
VAADGETIIWACPVCGEPILRTAAPELRQSFFYAGTCCNLDKYQAFIDALLERYGYPGWQQACQDLKRYSCRRT